MFLTVEENIKLLSLTSPNGRLADAVDRVFALFDLQYEGMRQVRLSRSGRFNNFETLSKLTLILVLLQECPVLLLDEPFEFLSEV